MKPSYDTRQLSAVLRSCLRCQKFFYFTDHQQTICVWCQRNDWTRMDTMGASTDSRTASKNGR